MGFSDSKELPHFVLFGDSLTQWSFDEKTEGFGWYLEKWYKDKVEIENEGYAGYTSQHIQRDYSELISRITKPGAPPTLLFTIFLGANDACFIGKSEYVPLPKFEDNIRGFVTTILEHEGLSDTKIVLITPPPINIPDPVDEDEEDVLDLGPVAAAAVREAMVASEKEGRAYRTYMSKKRYADKIMEIAGDYEETGRVIGLNYWKALIDAALEDQGRSGDQDPYNEDRLPGCGLKTAKAFRDRYFTDGLHLDALGYNVLSKALLDVVLEKWPTLAPDRIGS